MDRLLLHTGTAKDIVDVENSSSHAYILTGPVGSGKKTLAREIASRKLGMKDRATLDNYPYFLYINPENSTISIDRVREIQHFLSLRTTGSAIVRRAVIIADAHQMTREAQNALLKSLEEPPEDTVIILTATSVLGLLPTIRSRAQVINVMPCSKKESVEYFAKKGFNIQEIEKAHAISSGYAGLMNALLDEQENHVLVRHIQVAKKLITSAAYERLLNIETLSKNKNDIPVLLQSLKLICQAALVSPAGSAPDRATKLVGSLSLIQRSESAYLSNANTKLLLTNLFLHL